MRKDLLQRLAVGEVLVGGTPMHTLLTELKGRNLDGHMSEWIVEHTDDFQSVLAAMYEAGIDIGTGGTQGNGRYRLREFGLEDRLCELTLKQVQLAREVTPESCYLAGYIGKSGIFMEPVGDMTVEEHYKSYEEQIIPMLEGGVDLFLITENDTEQLVIAAKAVKDHCDLPVIAYNTFYSTKKGIRTLMGIDVETASVRLQEAGADVVGGYNGGDNPLGDALIMVKEMNKICDRPLLIGQDVGLPQLIDGKIVPKYAPEQLAAEVPNWIAAGASIVGATSGASLNHIRAIAIAAKSKRQKEV